MVCCVLCVLLLSPLSVFVRAVVRCLCVRCLSLFGVMLCVGLFVCGCMCVVLLCVCSDCGLLCDGVWCCCVCSCLCACLCLQCVCFVCDGWRDVVWCVCSCLFSVCVCVLLSLFNVFVRCDCRFAVLLLFGGACVAGCGPFV